MDIELGLQNGLTVIASTEFKRSYVSDPRSSIWYEIFREGGEQISAASELKVIAQ